MSKWLDLLYVFIALGIVFPVIGMIWVQLYRKLTGKDRDAH